MLQQSDNIRDYVFPIASAEISQGKYKLKHILGTAFLIGTSGQALTAKHVISENSEELLIGIFVHNNNWIAIPLANHQLHPSEDVALIQLTDKSLNSIFKLINTKENSSCRYHLFGYPDDSTYENTAGGLAIANPELVYNEGYIRRRIDYSLPGISGSSFYELSQVAGPGASGSPVFKISKNKTWQVIGIYIGEKTNERATSVSYAVRSDAFYDWKSKILEDSGLNESQK